MAPRRHPVATVPLILMSSYPQFNQKGLAMHIPCPNCGSENTTFMTYTFSLLALLEKILPKTRLSPGKYLVSCKDCGHTSIVMVD